MAWSFGKRRIKAFRIQWDLIDYLVKSLRFITEKNETQRGEVICPRWWTLLDFITKSTAFALFRLC